MKTTKNGGYVTFEITSFLPGRPVPKEFCQEAEQNGFWFFMPSDHTEENGWKSNIGSRRNFPMIYSPGFSTEEEALQAAEDWEHGAVERARMESGWLATMKTVEL